MLGIFFNHIFLLTENCFFKSYCLGKFSNATFFNVIEVLLSFRSMATLFLYRFTEICLCAWISLSFFPIILQDLQIGLSKNMHHPMDMSPLCNVKCVQIYKF